VLHRHAGTGGNDLLDALHSTDAAFGAFWDYLRASPYGERTLVLVTADHALARRAMRWEGGGNRLSPFDWIEGYLHVPGSGRWRGAACDRVVSQMDLAPTLLDVLDVDVDNPFLGLSVFSDRPAHPLVLGREPPPVDDPRLDDHARQAATAWSEEDQRRLLAYLTALARANRIRPDVAVHARRAASAEPSAAVGTMSAKERD
jgi:arylsulfatase A-like enzyme